MQDLAVKKYSPNDVSIIFVHWRKDISVVAPKSVQKDQLYAHLSSKKKDIATKNACII